MKQALQAPIEGQQQGKDMLPTERAAWPRMPGTRPTMPLPIHGQDGQGSPSIPSPSRN